MRRWKLFVVLGSVFLSPPLLHAQAPSNQPSEPQNQTADQKPSKSSKQEKQDKQEKQKSQRSLFKELDASYKNWLNEDVVYIIQDDERRTFLSLQTNEERDQFIEQFWQRRNPDPDSAVRYGQQSWEEMMVGFFDVAVDPSVDKNAFFVR